MKSFQEFMNAQLNEGDDPGQFHIIIIADEELLLDHSKEHLLNEGRWQPSDDSQYWKRVDNPHFSFERRHDKKTFNVNFKGMERQNR